MDYQGLYDDLREMELMARCMDNASRVAGRRTSAYGEFAEECRRFYDDLLRRYSRRD